MSSAQPLPKTLSFSTATLRDQKTMVWLHHQPPSVPWWRWDGVVTSLEAYERWQKGRSVIGLVLVTPDVRQGAGEEEWDVWREAVYRASRDVVYVVLSQACLQGKPETYWRENYDNLFVLEGMAETYPFLGGEWDGSVEDAIRMLALVGRYHRLVVPDAGLFLTWKTQEKETKPFYEMVVEEGTRPAEFVLMTQYYTAQDKKRVQELRECLRRNVKCRWVDRIVLLTERDESVAWASFTGKDKAKIEQRIIGKRLAYGDFFQEVGRRFAGKADAIVALANADIYFGEELAEAWRIQWKDRAICLLRWDDLGDGPRQARIFGPRPDSQDVWMFSAHSVAERHWFSQDVSIPLGVPGCDNAILRPLLQQRFLLSNPALSLKAYHLHNSGVRTYTKRDTVTSSVYIHLEPTYLVDSKQEFVPRRAPHHLCHEVVAFTVRSSSLSDEITYCTMLEKEGRFRWEPMVENYAFEPAIPVYTWSGGAAVTPNGLVYDLYRIYTGRAMLHQPEYNYWSSAKVDIFCPMVSCRRMAAVPVREARSVFRTWSRYVVEYLSRVLRLSQEISSGVPLSFWLPEAFRERMIRLFPSVDVSLGLPWEEKTPCWAEEVVGFLPGPTGAEMGREGVMALRQACPIWSSSSSPSTSLPSTLSQEKRCVIWRGGCWTSDTIREWSQTFFAPRGWSVIEVSSETERPEHLLSTASVMIWSSEGEEREKEEQEEQEEKGEREESRSDRPGDWLWCLPKGARVAEGQEEQEIRGEAQHLAHVADLEARVFLFGRGSPSLRMAEWREKLEGTGWF